MFIKIFPFLIALLIVLAIWEEFVREKRGEDFKKIGYEFTKSISFLPSFLQRTLDYFFNKFAIRQLLNPWFFFPATILFTFYFSQKISSESSTIVLLITFFAVMWYARETYALRNEQKKTNELIAGRPLVLIAKEIGNRVSIKNAGNNIARNIIVEFKKDGSLVQQYRFIVLGINNEIPYTIPEDLVKDIDVCNPQLLVVITYNNFQEQQEFETIYKTDSTVVIKPDVGRFLQISDTVRQAKK